MKLILFLCVTLSIVVLACHKKIIPAISTRTQQPVAPTAAAAPVYAAADIEAGKIIYTTKCVKCHKPKPVENYTVGRWVGIMKSMAAKSKLDSIQKMQVTAYVNTNAKK
jgi:mono/diheme cytochrome c family protein